MSTQRSSSNRYGNGTVSGALSRGGASGPSPTGPFTKGYGTGLVSLGTAKKPRAASSLAERKLSVPKPVNLPSLRKENAGNDPNTQLVPSGGGGGWQKPESSKEQQPEEQAPIITAGSSWASAPSSQGVPSWQPPQPFPVAAASAVRPRSLNPHEYPSLTVAASAKQSNANKQPVPHVPSQGAQGGGNWDEDERKPVFSGAQSRLTTESWADSHPEDEDRPPSRAPWESSAQNGRADFPGPAGDGSGRVYSDDRWTPKARAGFPPRPGFATQDREVEDPNLFPPPPPPRQPPPPPPPRAEQTREEVEAEKKAFEEEIDRVIEDERRRKQEVQEAARQHALEAEAEERAAAEKVQAAAPAPPPVALTEEQQAAAAEAAKQKVIALRKQREEEAQEAETRRKEAAQAKLKELEERIARKQAELEARAKEEEEEEKKEEEALPVPQPSAEAALRSAEEAAVEAVEASAEAAAESAKDAAGPIIAHIVSRDPTGGHASSVEAEAGSSIGGTEAMSELQALESTVPSEPASADNAESWNRGATASQPTHIWQRKDKEIEKEGPSDSADDSVQRLSQDKELSPIPQGDSGAASLFTDASGFGPSLVATSLGISKDDYAQQSSVNQEKPISSGPAMSWRAVLGGPTEEKPDCMAMRSEDFQADSQAVEAAGPDRGKGWGRGRRDQGIRDERQETGGRGERGRGKERGRARGRGRRQDSGSKDDISISSLPSNGQPVSENGASLLQLEGQQPRVNKQKGHGRGARGVKGDAEGRGRGRNNRVQNNGAQAEGSQQQQPGRSSKILPPGITPAAHLSGPSSEPQPPAVSHPEPGKWPGTGLADPQEMPHISNLSLSKPPGVFSPILDPLVTIGPNAKSDRAIDRPKSAAGAVARPKSSKPESLLPNGMPVLPNDLSLDAPGPEPEKPSHISNPISFGFQPSQNQSSFSPGPFPGVYFSGQPGSHNPWQPPVAHNMQNNLSEALNSFNNAAPSSFGQAASQTSSSQSQGLQFGAFGNFPQFGQLTSDFGQSPFIRTGKQPDWSTGPTISSNPPGGSGLKVSEALTGGPQPSSFSSSRGMDVVLPQGTLQKRGLQTAPGPPGPPGLQRQTQMGPSFSNGGPGLIAPLTQQQPPPGLQGPLPPLPHFSSHAPGLSQPSPGVGLDFGGPGSLPNHHMVQQGPPPGIGSRGSIGNRDQQAILPDAVFDTDMKPLMGNAPQQQLGSNNQVRRGSSDGRVRGTGRGSGGRATPSGRPGRNFGRGQSGSGGVPPVSSVPAPPGSNPRFQGAMLEGGILPHGFAQGRGAPLNPAANNTAIHHGAPGTNMGIQGHAKVRGMHADRGKGRGRGDRTAHTQASRGHLEGTAGLGPSRT